ncbi:unnamed protein product [Meganyctiphanes norvegica]|uniref:Uncharacterized protein n=1 Tax=Meganyctiphanes norvegica TaxID=48144 RepID=A0AAV2RHX9_MEGNR
MLFSNMRNSIALLCFITAVATASATTAQAKDGTDFTTILNGLLQTYLSTVKEPLVLQDVALNINAPLTADVLLSLKDPQLTGFTDDLRITSCTREENADTGKFLVNIVLQVDDMHLSASNLSMDGTLANHVPVFGGGEANIDIQGFSITLMSTATKFALVPPSILLDDLTIDMELHRWIVEVVGLMPGTDLGAVFNEFISMVGPELFDVLELSWNDKGNQKLLDLINGLFPPSLE